MNVSPLSVIYRVTREVCPNLFEFESGVDASIMSYGHMTFFKSFEVEENEFHDMYLLFL